MMAIQPKPSNGTLYAVEERFLWIWAKGISVKTLNQMKLKTARLIDTRTKIRHLH